MIKNEITIGKTYRAKISGKIAPVRIDAESRHGGWDATNLTTKKKIRIKSAAKLRSEYKPTMTSAKSKNATSGVPEPDGPVVAEAPKNATRPNMEKRNRPEKSETGDKRMSCLDAAAKVLIEEAKPMNCKSIVNMMLDNNYWTTNGFTPAATLYAAMLREIISKGDKSRFIKVPGSRGMFSINSEAA